jgi:two-component system cell cycle sensor histidine kinase/response regulator CckA
MSEGNERLYEEAQRRLREITTLYEASQACLSISDQKGLLAALIEAAVRATDAILGSVMLIDEEKGEYVFGAHYGLSQETIATIEAELHIPLGKGLVGAVVTTGQPVVVADVRTDPRWLPSRTKELMRSFLGVPLLGRDGQPLGAFNLACPEVGAFDEGHARLLSTFANQAAMAIENARLYEQAQREIAERKRAIEALRESEERYRRLVELSFDAVVIHREGKIVYINAAGAELLGASSPEELFGKLILDFVHPDYLEMAKARMLQTTEGGVAPLIEEKFIRLDGTSVDAEVVEIPITYRTQPAVQVVVRDITERKRVEEERERRSQELTMLNEVGRAVTSSLELKEVLALLLDRARQELDAEACSVALLDGDGDLVFHHAEGQGAEAVIGMRLKPGQGIAGWVAQSGQSALVPDAHANHHFYGEVIPGFTTRDMVCVPLVVRDEVIGVIELLNKCQGIFTKDDVRVLESVATQAATAIENARLYEQAQQEIAERKRAIEALRESEERYRRLVELSFDAIVIHREGKIVYINAAGAELLGASSPEELIGKPVLDSVQPDFLEIVKARMLQTAERRVVPLIEEKLTRLDGTSVDAEVLAVPITYQGHPAVQVVARDITERKRGEEALTHERDLLYALMDNIPDTIYFKDTASRFTRINRAQAQVLGVEPEEAVGKTDFDFFTAEHAHGAYADEQGIVKSGQPLVDKVERIRRADGQFRWVSVTKVPIVDKEGRVTGIVGISRDITERRRVEEALRESEEKYRTILENIEDGYYEVDIAGKLTFFNDALCKLLGYPEDELMGMNDRQLMDNETAKAVYQAFNSVYQTGKSVKALEHELIRKDGTRRFVEVSASLMRGPTGEPVGFRGIIRDITGRRKLEEQLRQIQKMEAIGTLAGGIAHDFNNLLTPIGGFADLLMWKTPEDSQQYEYLRQIKVAAGRAASLTSQLLTLARRVQVEVHPLNLNGVIREVIGLLGHTIDKAIAIEPHLADNLTTVEGDAGQLHQVLLNLCLNARDAMPDGGRLIIETQNVTLSEEEAQTELDLEAGQYVLLSVTDTGIGMDAETQQRLFEPFFTTKEEGRGLGLAMVYGIVRGHDGAIHVYSEPGRGSTFKVYLPAASYPAEDTALEEAEVVGGTETVLVVDDEEPVRALLQSILEEGGYTVLLAGDGIEATELYAELSTEIDLVVLDIVMPRMGGRETYERLREINPEVKVLLSSGYSKKGQARDILAAGARGFLQKPYDLRAVLLKVREVLEG